MALQTALIPFKALSSAAAPQVLPSTIRIEVFSPSVSSYLAASVVCKGDAGRVTQGF
jgi:hypothetical protein